MILSCNDMAIIKVLYTSIINYKDGSSKTNEQPKLLICLEKGGITASVLFVFEITRQQTNGRRLRGTDRKE